MSKPINLADRVSRTNKIIDQFRGRPFDWTSTATCIHLARAQMKALGHKPPSIPRFNSALSAKRALTAAGFADLESLLDSMLPRIPPAFMWAGDLALLEGEPPFDGIVVNAGGKVMGWHEEAPGLVPMIAHQIKAAWRL